MKRIKPPKSTFIFYLAALLAGCATSKPDGSQSRVDPKAVKVITKSAVEVVTDLLDAYLRFTTIPR